MKKLLNVLYGSLKFNKKSDYIIVPFKLLYIIFSLPFILFSFLLVVRSFGAFGTPKDEKIGIVKKVLLHIADVYWSFVFWIIIINAIL